MRNLFFYVIMGSLLISCGSKEVKTTKEQPKKESIDTLKSEAESNSFNFGLELFTNMEMVPYCLPLPLKKYKIDADQSDEKAKFIFTNINNSDYFLEVKGLLRSDESISLKTYFENSTSEEETEGQRKILEQKVLLEDKGCFWVTGYWSNFPENKFIELTFLRKEDIVTLYWLYDPATEGSDSFKIIREIIKYGSECDKYAP